MGLDFEKDLTKEQYAAVTHKNGPAMVVSGPGSGKTRTITYRIAYLVQKRKVAPHDILAITFTNKAAAEMKNRIEKLVPQRSAKLIRISTFHSLCAWMLRSNYKDFEVSAKYTIADTDDAKTYMIEAVATVLNISKKKAKKLQEEFEIAEIQAQISGYKNKLVRASDLEVEEEETPYRKQIVEIYQKYEKILKRSNSLDFDDLLLRVAWGFRTSRKLRNGYAKAYQHVLVDEYHDTNIAQYEVMKYLSLLTRSAFVVFDGDQSIYSWRGADPTNITKFQKDYSKPTIYKLEKNFRSVQSIADVANEVIVNNPKRIKKVIIPMRSEGEKVQCIKFTNPQQEALYIVQQIQDKVKAGRASYKDFTILYRINSLSRSFEKVLRYKGIPYKVVGALGFYQRKVIKDILAYLRLLNNITDYASFSRVYNEPTRGIGDKNYDTLMNLAQSQECSPLYLIKRGRYKDHISGRALDGVRSLKKMYKDLRAMSKKPIAPIVHILIERSGYRRYLNLAVIRAKTNKEKLKKAYDHIELLDAFEDAVAEYDNEKKRNLSQYLQHVALLQADDEGSKTKNQVLLMTIHSAKGLEFPHVYIVGCNEEILPHKRCMSNDKDLEEERRLFFVAVSRAEDFLTLSHFNYIPYRVEGGECSHSRFLDEANETLKHIDLTRTGGGENKSLISLRRSDPSNYSWEH